MKIPDKLYHYTSQKGLLGILQSNKLWMTNIFHLNDSSEFSYTVNLVKTELKKSRERLEKEGLLLPDKKNLYDKVQTVLGLFQSERVIGSYVFSLSTKRNDLNQWRGYCPKEGGFSIEFDTKKLLSIIDNIDKSKKYDMKKCEYKNIKQEKLVKSLIDKIDDDMKLFYTELVYISSYIKHDSFMDEDEYRIISHGIPHDIGHREIRHREGKSMIIPYVEFSPLDDKYRLPISKIIVGPTPYMKLSLISVESLLKSKGYEIEVEPSNIPYRSW